MFILVELIAVYSNAPDVYFFFMKKYVLLVDHMNFWYASIHKMTKRCLVTSMSFLGN